MHRKPGAAQRLRSSHSFQKRSSQASQLMAEFARGAEKRVLHGFLGGAQGVTDGPELQALIVLHLKNNSFARGQALHGNGDARLDFLADESALGVQRRALLALPLEKIGDALLVKAGIQFRSLIFGARLTAAQDRKSTRLNSSHGYISYAVFCLKKKK